MVKSKSTIYIKFCQKKTTYIKLHMYNRLWMHINIESSNTAGKSDPEKIADIFDLFMV
jgi:hypothetical protein